MSSSAVELDRSIFGFVDVIAGLQSPDDVIDALARVLAADGAEFFCVNFLPQPEEDFADVLLASRLPPGWLALYEAENYVHDDPAIRHCRRTARPFDWDAAPFDPQREPRAAELARRMKDFGLARGFVTPVPAASATLGCVLIAGPIQPTQRARAAMHLASIYAFDRLRSLATPVCRHKASLTTREREVLVWIANGKSAWEIGEILTISKRTVDEHTQAALRKLGAANRAQAVAIAMRDRIIAL